MKLNERGRGKFKPAPNLSRDEVKQVLMEKIAEEMSLIIESSDDEVMLQNLDYKKDRFNLLSLFSGCGGLDLGFELAGLAAVIGEEAALEAFKDKDKFNEERHKSIFHTIYTNDLFEEANDSYKVNFPQTVVQHRKDIRKVKNFPKADVVVGGFPCPGFSEAGPRLIDDERNFLYIHFIRCLIQTQPYFFIAENVKGMMNIGGGEVLKQIVEDFASAGYRMKYKLLNSRDYGVPQLRERVILVGIRNDLDFEYEYPEPTHGDGLGLIPYVTLQDAIGDLREDPGPYFTGSFSTIYLSRNRKKRWEEQSFTIQASGRQAPLHPDGPEMVKLETDKWDLPGGEDLNRRLSVKEIARIQTFPDWYEFKTRSSKASDNAKLDFIYKQIGNAVPVLLAKAIAAPLAKWAVERFADKQPAVLRRIVRKRNRSRKTNANQIVRARFRGKSRILTSGSGQVRTLQRKRKTIVSRNNRMKDRDRNRKALASGNIRLSLRGKDTSGHVNYCSTIDKKPANTEESAVNLTGTLEHSYA